MVCNYRKSLLALTLIAALGIISGCTKSEGPAVKRIILVTNGNSPFWDACRAGLMSGNEDFKLAESNLQAIMEVNDGTPQGQIDKLRQFGAQSDIVAVAVSAVVADNAAIADEMRNLRKKGIHVISVDADVNREKFRDARQYYIGTDNLTGGKVLGTAAKHLLTGRNVTTGSYVQFVGHTGSDNARKRMDGFQQAVGEDYKEADRMGDEMDLSRAKENVRNALRNHNDLVSLVGIWSYNAPAIVDVVTQENKRDDFTIVTFDAEPIAIRQMGEGHIDAMVVQNPYDMGYQAVRLLKAMIQDDQQTMDEMFPNQDASDGDIYGTGLKVVVPDENSPLKADLFDENTEFLILSEFKAWLTKYELEGS